VSGELPALLLSGALIASVGVALAAKKVSTSLIALFYSAIILGVTFTFYGDSLLGLLTMVTFAGAVSVLLLTVILITGEAALDIGARGLALLLAPLTALIGVASLYALGTSGSGVPSTADTSLSVFAFAWTQRPWDLLILMVVFAAAMVAVVNMLGGDERVEP
jgi:NADH:ubiquinone oxidoreductase subunit 6 (subunit J)